MTDGNHNNRCKPDKTDTIQQLQSTTLPIDNKRLLYCSTLVCRLYDHESIFGLPEIAGLLLVNWEEGCESVGVMADPCAYMTPVNMTPFPILRAGGSLLYWLIRFSMLRV